VRQHVSAAARTRRAGQHQPRKSSHVARRKANHVSRQHRKHPHKGSHAPRRKHHLSAAARARRVGRKHPHKGHASKGWSAAARAKAALARRGKPLSASHRAAISRALKGRKRR
jgi:hypothetical protein